LPHLIDLYNKHRAAGLQVVAITTEDAAAARAFAKQQGVPFPILIDANGTVSKQYRVASIPVTVLLDKQGRAAGMAEGYSQQSFEEVASLAEQLLKE
jgi:cytochrome c biogenesis protein CcmG/thiol:disulfide interchange protein DsbE